MQGLFLFFILSSPWTSKRVAVHVDSRCTSRLRRADGLSPLTVFDTDVTKASEGGCSEVAVVFGATLFGCPGHREPLSRAAAVLVWAPAHHGARSRRADPMATHLDLPHPAPPARSSLTPAATSSGCLALWRTPVCLGAPRLTVVYRLKFLLGLLEQRLARCNPPSCARSG
jgi:hypothetical protein